MGKLLFYTQNKDDLERVVKQVVSELRKTEFFDSTPIDSANDRLTQKEAAKFLGVSIPTLIDYKKKSLIPYFKVGRSIFYSKAELIEASRMKKSKF